MTRGPDQRAADSAAGAITEGAQPVDGEFLLVERIVSSYGPQEILHGISLSVSPGEVVAIIGPNGSGKSTVLKTIMRFLQAWQGRVVFEGTDLVPLSPDRIVRLGISFVTQGRSVFPDMTVDEHLDMGAWILGSESEKRAALARVRDLFPRLMERRTQTAKTMSGGEQQMLSLARALMISPKLLILDEPTLGLAPKLVDLIFEKVSEINRELGAAILMVEQNAAMALENSHRGYVLEMGNNKYQGPSHELLRDERVLKAYLGG
jgi:ABC-type branched-subunit amino acid transport system ATPase component